LLVCDLNAKRVDSISRLNKIRVELLRDYDDEKSCLILVSDTPTINLLTPSAITDILDFVSTKKISSSIYLIRFSALSSDHLQVLIDTNCHSSFHQPPDRSHFRRTAWTNFLNYFIEQIPFNPELYNVIIIDTCVENILRRRSEGSISFSQVSPA
jgi:hypothetical protein